MASPVAALSNLVVKLGELALQEANYLDGVGEKLTRLRTELIWMKCFLKDAAAANGSREEVVAGWVAEVRELAYEAEDIIDTFDIKAPSKRRASILKEDWWLHKMGKKMDALTEKISVLTRRAQTYGLKPAADHGESSARWLPLSNLFPNEIEKDVVGFDGYMERLVSVLQDKERQRYEVVVIAGMGGLGKTTLAEKVYHCSEIRGHFKQLAWVSVSQQYQLSHVWKQILSGIECSKGNEILNLTDPERIHRKLREEKCLVVLDDVWNNEDWNRLVDAFPMNQQSNLSKIMITSRHETVASGPTSFLLKPDPLKVDESRELLRRIVFPSSQKKRADRTCIETDDARRTSAQEGAEITKEMDDPKIDLAQKGVGNTKSPRGTAEWARDTFYSGVPLEASEPKSHVLQERTGKTQDPNRTMEEEATERTTDIEDPRKSLDNEDAAGSTKIEDSRRTLVKEDEVRITDTKGPKKKLEKEVAEITPMTKDPKRTLEIEGEEITTNIEDPNRTLETGGAERTTNRAEPKRTLEKEGAVRTIMEEDSKMKLAHEMVKHCGGLPLAIRVLGGLLTTSSTEWSKIHEDIKSLIARGGNQGQENKGVRSILATSYKDLPTHLKSCFIYMAQFPENYDISVDKLEKMWIAEGMVEPMQVHWEERHEELEDLAKSYLNQLIQRSMILVGNKGPNNELETCHLHDFMRDLCLSKAKEENMLQILNKTVTNDKSGVHSMAKIGNVRRLAIHELDLLYPNPYLRSLWFFCDIFPRKELEAKLQGLFPSLARARKAFFYSRQFWVFVTNTYKLVRVLDLEGVSLRVLPSEIGELIYLKMLIVGGIKVKKLPSSLGKLWCLQTLDLEKASILRLANVVWKLEQLRHLHLPRACHVWKFNIGRWRNLRTLRNFRFQQGCEAKRFGELAQLRELGVIIDLNDRPQDLLEAFSRALVNLRNLRSLSMNIIYKPGNKSSVKNKLSVDIEPILTAFVKGCPNVYKLELSAETCWINFSENALVFPASITHLALSYCWSDDSLISKLGKFPNLRFLTLSILQGHVGWRIQGFHKLVFLAFRGLRSLEELIIDKEAMPRLEHMEISYCGGLKRAPEGLRFIESLQELKIMGMPKAFNDRLDPKGADYEEVKDIPSVLLIDPFEEPAELDPGQSMEVHQDSNQIGGNSPDKCKRE